MDEKNNNNLIWLDMEMSGLDPENDKVLEIAVVITDPFLTIIAESPVFVIHQEDAVLARMDAWNQGTHGKSGLIEKVKNSKHNEEGVTRQLLEFMAKHMPELESFFHYRNLDVSVFKELSKRWKPEIIEGFKKAGKHEALADIMESIEELKYYREHFIKI